MVHQRQATKFRRNGLLDQGIIDRTPLQNQNGIIGEKKSAKKNIQHSSLPKENTTHFFPKISPWIISLVVLIVRLNYVSQPKNWWILHPDEIFQSLEVAHSEVYGYGFRPYEYLPPILHLEPKGRRQEISYGMFSLRSFLFPKFFILTSKFSHIFLGDNIHPFLIWKMSHAAVSSLLPIAVYMFTVTIYRSHDSGVLSCALVAFSVHLSVLGTHTLMSSFFSPLVFFTLPTLWSIFYPDSGIGDEAENNQRKCAVTNHSQSGNGNQDGIPKRQEHKNKNRKIGSKSKTTKPKSHHLFICGFCVGIFVYIRFDLLVFYVSLFLPVAIVHWSELFASFQKLVLIASGFCLGICVGITDDYRSYSSFVISPYQWFMFNVLKDFSSTFFGRSDTGFYVNHILLHNFSMVAMFLLTCLTLVISVAKRDATCKFRTKQTVCLLFSTTTMFISYTLKGHKEIRFLHNFIVLLMIVYSSTLITIWQYLQAKFLFLSSKTATAATTSLSVLALAIYAGHQWHVFPDIESFGDWSYLNNQQSGHANECLYYISQQGDVSGVFLDQSIHTSGAYSLLHLDVPLLTLIQTEFYEFNHDSKLHIRRLPNWLSVKQIPPDDTIGIYALCNVSDYVSIYNTQYLLKHLITRTEYNYVLLKKTRQFIQIGFKQVFESGSMKVLKRVGDTSSEKNLGIIARQISPLSSFTSEEVAGDVLLHEAHFLYSYGRYKLSEERLSIAARLKSPRVEVYQLLFNLYRGRGEEDKATFYWRKCVKNYSRTTCLKTVEITDIYDLSKKW